MKETPCLTLTIPMSWTISRFSLVVWRGVGVDFGGLAKEAKMVRGFDRDLLLSWHRCTRLAGRRRKGGFLLICVVFSS